MPLGCCCAPLGKAQLHGSAGFWEMQTPCTDFFNPAVNKLLPGLPVRTFCKQSTAQSSFNSWQSCSYRLSAAAALDWCTYVRAAFTIAIPCANLGAEMRHSSAVNVQGMHVRPAWNQIAAWQALVPSNVPAAHALQSHAVTNQTKYLQALHDVQRFMNFSGF